MAGLVQRRGASRMRELRRVQVVVWLRDDDAREVDEIRGRVKRATWVRRAVLHQLALVRDREKAA